MNETVIDPIPRRGEPLVSIIIPIYNSPAVEPLVGGIDDVFRQTGNDYEIILVDDGSPDARIWPTLDRLARDSRHVRAVQLTRNFGQQAATLCGLREARGEIMITMDDDLQHKPGDIPLLLAHADHDIVIAQLGHRKHHILRRLASDIKGLFDQIVIGKPKHLHLSSFRLIRRTVVEGILSIRTPNPFLPALLFHVSKDVVGVAVEHEPRLSGRSGYTPGGLLRIFSNLIINNSSILLRTAALTGVIIALSSFAVAATVIYRKLAHGIAVQGWASLFAAILLMGGMVLLGIGVIGEYLIRIIESSEERPSYFIRRRSG